VEAPTKGRDRRILGANVDDRTERKKERSVWEQSRVSYVRGLYFPAAPVSELYRTRQSDQGTSGPA
jgi:hypothetical protein